MDDKLLELESQKESKVAAWQAEDQKLKELDVKFKDIEAQMKIKIDAADNIKVPNFLKSTVKPKLCMLFNHNHRLQTNPGHPEEKTEHR